MLRLLVPVDGSPGSDSAVKHLIRIVKSAGAAEVRVLHVQPAIPLRGIEPVAVPGLIERLQHDEGERATQSALKLLNDAAIRNVCSIESGDVPETIATYVKTHGCDEVIMGTRGMARIHGLVLGSVATEVVHLVDVPVTLVK